MVELLKAEAESPPLSEQGAVSESSSQAQLQRQLSQLRAENQKLRKINSALMERVESGVNQQEGAYGHFEHAVFLAEQVRERTHALNCALAEVKQSNQALKQASAEAGRAHRNLQEAIESISDAFVLYGRDRRLLLANSNFLKFWQASGVEIRPGVHIDEIMALAKSKRLIERYYSDGLAASGTPLGDGKVFRMRSGSWLQVSQRDTGDGGLVVLYKDITALIENERAVRERALAHKSKVLQHTLDNLSQSVVLVNQHNQLEAWNSHFCDLTGVDSDRLRPGDAFDRVMADTEVCALTPDARACLQHEQYLSDGRILEICSHALPSGGFVNTYTDISERSRAVAALAASERRIRLITDAVPALIAFVDRELTFTFTNRAYENWYGWGREEIFGRRLDEVVPEERLQQLLPFVRQALTGQRVSFEIDEQTHDGQSRHVIKSYVPQVDPQGEVHGFYVLVQDITEQRRNADALEQSHQNLEHRVEERTAELTAVNRRLVREIDERRQVEARLIEARREAEQANYSKTKFLAAASHDLLQPMNAGRLFAASLLEHPLGEKTRGLVQSLNYSLEDVESLLAALVDISKLDAGVVKPDITAFSANRLLANLANEFQTLAGQGALRFSWVPSSASIATDSQLLARILRNFLSNALRYTPEGRVTLGCRRQAGGLLIQVWDTGIGIAEDKLGEIFQEFNRVQQNNSAKDRGLGLGLAIVDKVSRILDHPVIVRSTPGKGSCFSVLVPYGAASPEPAGAFAAAQTPLQRLCNQRLEGSRVLVIDNEQSICEAMRLLLEGWGCRVTTALSYPDLCRQLAEKEGTFDLVVVDYHLDDQRTGLEAVRRMRTELAIDAPVLMITANYSNDLKQQVRALGYQLMNKPVRPARLKTTLEHLLQKGKDSDRHPGR
ncbi:NahK/ErcS family hybrid sensor histidine kinase/response regulator [Motiliproteus sp. SC1-56]|uniref:NahK/ErcS family hybrid sensor histidine kinase/response regulator n=1 Tax=Motiliproteus sp. SC1-56 TaxID=2799565 RepID=UPI001A8FFBAB|nr:NahK/ErcS family hybrid sensor histidine kinase/response regulator [Motiliproteus sp. SC1-56]